LNNTSDLKKLEYRTFKTPDKTSTIWKMESMIFIPFGNIITVFVQNLFWFQVHSGLLIIKAIFYCMILLSCISLTFVPFYLFGQIKNNITSQKWKKHFFSPPSERSSNSCNSKELFFNASLIFMWMWYPSSPLSILVTLFESILLQTLWPR